jgi:hypothetical protein
MPFVNPLETPPRVSRSGRLVQGSYHNDTPLQTIADTSSPTQAREIEKEAIKTATANAIFVMRQGKITILDLLKEQIYGDNDKERRSTREFMRNGGALALMKLCIDEFGGIVKPEICSLAQVIYQKEFEELHRSPELRQPADACTPEKLVNFSFEIVLATMIETALKLSGLTRALVLNDDSNSLLANSNDSGQVESAVPDSSDDDSEEDDNVAQPTHVEQVTRTNLTNKAEKKIKRQTAILTKALSTLCYARNRLSNCVQMQIGYYLLAAGTPTRVIEVEHQLGGSVSISSVRRAMKAVAKVALSDLQTVFHIHPRSSIVFDNMDFTARVRDQRSDHQGKLLHYCAGFLSINPKHVNKPSFTADDVQLSRVSALHPLDILPAVNDKERMKHSFCVAAYDTLIKYCCGTMTYTKSSGKKLKPFMLQTLRQLDTVKSFVWTLRAYARNEADVAELSKLLWDIEKDLNMERKDFWNKKIALIGDWLTTRNNGYL